MKGDPYEYVWGVNLKVRKGQPPKRVFLPRKVFNETVMRKAGWKIESETNAKKEKEEVVLKNVSHETSSELIDNKSKVKASKQSLEV